MSRVNLEFRDRVAHLVLSRPDSLNALDQALLREFEQALAQVKESSATMLVTSGQGRAYSAGSDLKELAACSPEEAARFEAEHGRVFGLLDDLPQITVASWRGYVLGGGVFLGIYHDFRLATEEARIGMPEVTHGWTPPWGISRLVELVGWPVARRLLLGEANMDGSGARAIGLVDAIWPEEQFDDQMPEWVQKIASRSPAALAETKALLRDMRWLDHEEWDRRGCEAFARCYATPEAREAVDRFLKRR